MRVLIVIITADRVEDACWRAATRQTHADTNVLVCRRPPRETSSNPTHDLYKNCAAARESARKLAITSDADAFLFLDSDIVLPPAAVEEFVKQHRPGRIVGGWYPVRNDPHGRYVCGRYVADGVFLNYRAIEPSLIQADVVGLGCAFVPRGIAERVGFRDGCDMTAASAIDGVPMIHGECGAFGADVQDAGFELFMDGDVVCEHLGRTVAA